VAWPFPLMEESVHCENPCRLKFGSGLRAIEVKMRGSDDFG